MSNAVQGNVDSWLIFPQKSRTFFCSAFLFCCNLVKISHFQFRLKTQRHKTEAYPNGFL